MTGAASNDIYIGLMSGTSLDGIDIAVVNFSGQHPEVIHCNTTPYQSDLQNRIREITQSPSVTLDQLYSLDTDLGRLYSDFINHTLDRINLDSSEVTAIGCHGQTIRHRPDIASAFTAQIGDPNQITAKTGIATVADFRRKDMAFGGQGAPLACAFHKARFQSPEEDRAVINIGGISNVTFLPADEKKAITGFDTGPGNTLVNYWCQQHLGESYDAGG
ncbi:MAG: anhydro-N-acetylmuramic acid kinase, partial [Pseudomonadota bacterium]